MKETLHGFGVVMVRKENRREISDVRILSALAHPVRVQLLGFLLEVGPRTATQCAAVAGVSPSACSYHLRRMAAFGLVERVGPDEQRGAHDGRDRPWRASATGFSFGAPASQDGPASRAARRALSAASIDESARLAKQYLAAADTRPPKWQDAANFSTYGLSVTPKELRALVHKVDHALRPFIAATRDDAPTGAELVHITLQAFPRVDRG